MNDRPAGAKQRTCYKCGFFGMTDETDCPNCRAPLFSVTATRVRGAILAVLGLFLTAFMGYLSIWAGQAFQNTDPSGTRFTGTGQERLLIIGLFGLLILFGLFAIVTGAWQLIAGRRSRTLSRLAVLVGVVIAIGAGAVIFWM